MATINLQILDPVDSVIWTGPQNFESQLLNPDITEPGVYSVQIFASNGCTVSDQFELILENVPFDLSINGTPFDCIEFSTELCAESLNSSISEYNWSFNNDNLGNSDCISVSEIGLYKLVAIDQNGCSAETTYNQIDLSQEIMAEINASSENISCQDSEIVLQGVILSNLDHLVFQWLDDDNILISEAEEVMVTSSGTYTFNVLDTLSNCETSQIIIIEEVENQLLDVVFSIEQASCLGDPAILNIDGLDFNTATLLINNELYVGDNPIEIFDMNNVNISILDNNSCTLDTNFMLFEGFELMLDLGPDVEVTPGSIIDLDIFLNIDADAIAEFQWSNPDSLSCTDCLNPSFSTSQNEELQLTVIDTLGCLSTDILNITIDEKVNIFFPNIFTPNDDGNNDELTIYLSDGINAIFDLRIFDRWGNLVLFRPQISDNTTNFMWDGNVNGIPAEQGVYVYVAKLLLQNGQEQLISGNFTLLR